MKLQKWFTLGMAMLLLLGVTGCRKESAHFTDPEYHLETDEPYYLRNNAGRYLAESPEGYYYISRTRNGTDRGFLRFVDKETMQDTVVCGKPDCLHGSISYMGDPEERCNAFVHTLSNNLSCYDGYVYMVTEETEMGEYFAIDRQYYLTQISPNGNNRKNIWEISFDDEIEEPSIDSFGYFVHRGRFYFSVSHRPKNGKGEDIYEEFKTYWYSYDLNTGQRKLLKITDYQPQEPIAKGDRIYFSEEMRTVGEEIVMNYQYYAISTGESTVIEEEFRNHFFYEGGHCYGKWMDEDDFTQEDVTRCFFCDDDGNVVRTMDIPKHINIAAANESYIFGTRERYYFNEKTGDQISESLAGDAYATQELINQGYVCVWSDDWEVYDAETMEQIDTIPFPEGMDDEIRIFQIYLSGDKAIVFDSIETSLYFGDLDDLGTGNFEWKLAEKIN